MAGSPTSPFAPGDTPVSSAPVSPFSTGDVAHAASPVSPFSAQDTQSPAIAPSPNAAPVTSPAPPQSPSVGPQFRGRFGMVNTAQQPVTAGDYAGAGANALDSATFGADRLLPSAVSGPINTARLALQKSDPTAASVSQGLGAIVSPVAKLAGPIDALVPDAVRASQALTAAKNVGTAGAAGAAYGYGTSNNTGAARTQDALNGAEGGAALGAAGEGLGAAVNHVATSALSKIDPVLLNSRANVSAMIRKVMSDGEATGQPMSATQAANSVFHNLNSNISGAARALKADPTLTEGQRQGVIDIFPALQNQAGSAKNTLGLDASGTPDGTASQALTQFHQLGIDPAKTGPITDGLRDLDTLSQNKFLKHSDGPLATLGGKIGQAAPALAGGVLGLEFGGPVLGEVAGGLGVVAHNAGGKIGTAIGGAADRALGLATPPVLKQGDAAAAYLKSVGIPQGPLSLKVLQDANNARYNAPGVDPNVAAFQKMVDTARAKQAVQSNIQAVKDQAAAVKANTTRRGADVTAAFGLSPEEAMMNKAATTNETVLRASETQSTAPDAGLTATNAAVNQLKAKADAIRAAGGEMPAADGAPDGPTPVPPSPPPVTPAPTPGAAPSPIPAAPQGQPDVNAPGDRRQTLSDFLTHTAIAGHGTLLTPAHITQGIDAATAAGDINADQAQFYKGSLGAPLDNSMGMHNGNLNTILAHSIAAKTGGTADAAPLLSSPRGGAASSVPNGGPEPVVNAYKYNASVAPYHANARAAAAMLERAGNLAAAAKVMEIAGEPDVATKQALASEFMASETDPIKRAQAAQFLKGRLLTQGKKQ